MCVLLEEDRRSKSLKQRIGWKERHFTAHVLDRKVILYAKMKIRSNHFSMVYSDKFRLFYGLKVIIHYSALTVVPKFRKSATQ